MTTGDIWRSPDGAMELRCGRWQEVLGDVAECDLALMDPPYGEKTHSGQRHGRHDTPGFKDSGVSRRGLGYVALSEDELTELCSHFSARVKSWMCVFTSHDLVCSFQSAMGSGGLYSFAPIACVQPGMNVRLAGDGPSNWTVYAVVARTKSAHKWGTLPGAYITKQEGSRGDLPVAGAKPLALMRAIVRDYSRPGDLIVDPYAGGGTTLLAAAIEGRRCIGAECDPETYRKAVARLRAGYTPRML